MEIAGRPFPANLICPRCRRPAEDGRLTISHLVTEWETSGTGEVLRCPLCDGCYPFIEGIPCVPPDPEAFRRSQAASIGFEWIHDTAERAVYACRLAEQLDPGGDAFREIAVMALHAIAHFPQCGGELSDEFECNRSLIQQIFRWLQRHSWPQNSAACCALEAGCGPGAMLRQLSLLFPAGALGLDLRIGTLRLARRLAQSGEAFLPFCVEGRRFEPVHIAVPAASETPAERIHLLQGDILDPPLQAEAFPVVVALSLLDSVADPLFALGQLDALVAPGGLLVLGTPYSWDSRVTAAADWWSGPERTGAETLRAALGGGHPALPHLRYTILQQAERAPWAVPGHGRLVYRFFLDLVLARKS